MFGGGHFTGEGGAARAFVAVLPPPGVFSLLLPPRDVGGRVLGVRPRVGLCRLPGRPVAGAQDAAVLLPCPQHPQLGRAWLGIASRGSGWVRPGPSCGQGLILPQAGKRCRSTHGLSQPDQPCSLLPRWRGTFLVLEVGAGTQILSPRSHPPCLRHRCSPVPPPVPPRAARGLPSLLLAGSAEAVGSPVARRRRGTPPGTSRGDAEVVLAAGEG